MKQLFAFSWAKGFAAGVLVCAAATLVPFYIQQAFAQEQPGGHGRLLHAPGTFLLAAPGGQSTGVYLIDTRMGDTWYNAAGNANWFACGNPAAPKPGAPQN